ncbi:hypothetical protein AWB73_01124 [Caballeronia turbans]|nr:hypothetical protein AWB73_01124 [Caballeronia turbans]
MKRILTACVLVLASAQAIAEPAWVEWSKTSKIAWYVDANSVRRSGTDGVAMWVKYVLPVPDAEHQNAKASVIHLDYRCGAPFVGIDSMAIYDGNGRLILTNEQFSKVSAPPGSVYEDMMDGGCKVAYRKQ